MRVKRKVLLSELKEILNYICVDIGERLTGSENNKWMESHAKNYFEDNDYKVELQDFLCIDWKNKGAELSFGGKRIRAKPSYYTRSCSFEGEYIKIASIDELKKCNLNNKIAVLYDDLVKEQIMPKNSPFYNPDRHKKIIRILEQKNPVAIVTIVEKEISIFEDGDFNIPSVYVTKENGDLLLQREGKLKILIDTARKESKGANVIAKINPNKHKKIVITAHMDTKWGTPGALDNGTGIAILLIISKLIEPEDIDYCLELLLLNGEDYYSTPGQIKYMNKYLINNENIVLSINCDGVGLKDSITVASMMGLGKREKLIKDLIQNKSEIQIIEPWVEGDHMLFTMNNIPAIAFTSKDIFQLIDSVIHTEKDKLDIISFEEVLKVISFLKNFLVNLKLEDYFL